MNEKNFPRHESGTPFHDGDQVDTQSANPDLIPYDELAPRRRREAFEREVMNVISPELKVLSPSEQLGQLHTVALRRRHIEKLNQGEFDQTA